ncbi:MAG: GNAT family N-acetyltransferase [Alphaproteobacteria bacterium]|nr:GNAT family N-acetyltransferase [Alphaproteobacteria bacterium]
MTISHKTDRLYFAMMTKDDGDLMLNLDSDPEVMRHITHGKTTTAAEMRDFYIPRMLSYYNPAKGWGLWKAFRRTDDEFIGWFLLRPMADDPQAVEIGWRFKQEFWGMGYGTEGARLFRDHAFGQDNVRKLVAIALPENKGSRRIMEKIGMSYIKTYSHKDPQFPAETVVLYEMVNVLSE